MSLAALLLTGCPVYGDAPTCNGPGCYDDDDDDDWCDDDDDHGGSAGHGGYAGSGGYAGKAGSGGYGGGSNPPRHPISINEYQQLLRLDAASVPRAEAAELVYVDFHAAYNNNRYTDAELGAFANATLKLINQLDVRATAANGEGAVIVLDDRNLPLAVRFNPIRFNLDKQQDIIDTIVRLDNRQDLNNPFSCEIPAIPVLDFLHIASSDDVFNTFGDNGQGTFESGYANVALRRLLEDAGIAQPGQLVFDAVTVDQFIANGFTNISNNFDLYDALEAVDAANFDRQSLDTLYNVSQDDSRLVRGCLLNSNVSAANRCIDRLTQTAPSNGATYLTFDIYPLGNGEPDHDFFAAAFRGPNNPPGNPLVHPAGGPAPFAVDGGEAIYQLKNSMLGFLTFNGNFQLLSQSSYGLEFGDPTTGFGMTNASCNYCHSSFTIPFTDAMLPTLLGAPGNPDFEFAFGVAQSQDSWDTSFTVDAAFYQEALRNVYFAQDEYGELPDGIWSLGKHYLNDMAVEDVAAELGVFSPEALIDALYNSTDPAGFELADQLASGGISRQNFTINYQLLVELIATGNEDFLRGCVVREASDPGDFPDEDPGDGFRQH